MEEEALKTEKIEAFEKAFENEARNMAKSREMVIAPPGMKFRRHPIDELKDHHELTGSWLREELERIILKRSQLSAAQRHLIVKLALSARIKMNAGVKEKKERREKEDVRSEKKGIRKKTITRFGVSLTETQDMLLDKYVQKNNIRFNTMTADERTEFVREWKQSMQDLT